jgi:extradiol dioxygenase family protein
MTGRDQPGRRPDVPVRHFGVVVRPRDVGRTLAERFRAGGVKFVIEPYVRSRASRASRRRCFFLDPFG